MRILNIAGLSTAEIPPPVPEGHYVMRVVEVEELDPREDGAEKFCHHLESVDEIDGRILKLRNYSTVTESTLPYLRKFLVALGIDVTDDVDFDDHVNREVLAHVVIKPIKGTDDKRNEIKDYEVVS